MTQFIWRNRYKKDIEILQNPSFGKIMTFIASFLLVCSVSLVVRGQNDNDIPIEQCVKNVVKTARQDNGQIKKRPNIDPSSCLDLDAGSCTLFALRQQDNYAINVDDDP